ncbi:MAG: NAD(P)/FAD-dependent oxidoreductase [Bacteroidia bacterium]|nr:NAD(P)/FAD-dependent oxidoreductase [Bacteroidia bacterium]
MHTAIIIGSGFSGIAMAIRMKSLGLEDFIILEKSNDVGGTWRDNTYPGAECDIPSALYSYSFEPYLKWEYKWSHQDQILEYIRHCATKYEIYPHIHFGQEMKCAHWDETKSSWMVTTGQGKQYETRSFISAIGQLHFPSVPEFKGEEQFEGAQFHSAEWDHEVQLSNKRVGVIGNAASAVQFIPEIAKTAAHVTIFQRSANWMLPKQDRLYKAWEKKLVRAFPFLLKIYRLRLWLLGGVVFFLMKKGNGLLRSIAEKISIRYINRVIKDTELRKKLIPNYPIGAKRILFSDNYYHALNRSNVRLVTNSIDRINSDSITDVRGELHELDVIIYATGFKTNPFLMGREIIGINGVSIHETWKDGPKNYLGMTVAGFPNFFMMYGPNTNLGHNSILIMSEAQAKYIADCIQKMKDQSWKSLVIKNSAFETYNQEIQERLQNSIWAQIEKSWYKSASGHIPNNWPGRTMEYLRRTKKVDFSAYQVS